LRHCVSPVMGLVNIYFRGLKALRALCMIVYKN